VINYEKFGIFIGVFIILVLMLSIVTPAMVSAAAPSKATVDAAISDAEAYLNRLQRYDVIPEYPAIPLIFYYSGTTLFQD